MRWRRISVRAFLPHRGRKKLVKIILALHGIRDRIECRNECRFKSYNMTSKKTPIVAITLPDPPIVARANPQSSLAQRRTTTQSVSAQSTPQSTTTSPFNPALPRLKMGNASSAVLENIVQGSNCMLAFCRAQSAPKTGEGVRLTSGSS